MISGHPPPAARRALLAASLLRHLADTTGARLFKDHVAPGLTTWAAVEDAAARLARVLGPFDSAAVARAHDEADQALARADASDARLLTIADHDYPDLLRHLPDPPIALWARGLAEALSAPSVAIVGSRNAGPVGLETARRLARGVAAAGLVVTSGLAKGIDEAAHRGALEGGGRTTAVLGSGIDVIYPRQHAGLVDRILPGGSVISEFPPGAPPLPHHFPLRNRLISGLSHAVVIVEASERSGSLITARLALEQGRDVLAVPGNVVSGCHRGCHALIKDGARLVETVEDILEEIGWEAGRAEAAEQAKSRPHNRLLAGIRSGDGFSVDDLAARTGRAPGEILAELGRLELDGLIARSGVGTFIRLD